VLRLPAPQTRPLQDEAMPVRKRTLSMLVRELTKRNASNSFCLVRRWGTLGSAAAHVIALANGRLCLRFSWGGLPEILLTYARNLHFGERNMGADKLTRHRREYASSRQINAESR